METIIYGLGVINIADIVRKIYKKSIIESEVTDELSPDCLYSHVVAEPNNAKSPDCLYSHAEPDSVESSKVYNYSLYIKQYKYTEFSLIRGIFSISPLMCLFGNPLDYFRSIKDYYTCVNLYGFDKSYNFSRTDFDAFKISDIKALKLDPNISFPKHFSYSVYADVYKPGEHIYLYIKNKECLHISRCIQSVAKYKYSLIPNGFIGLATVTYFALCHD